MTNVERKARKHPHPCKNRKDAAPGNDENCANRKIDIPREGMMRPQIYSSRSAFSGSICADLRAGT